MTRLLLLLALSATAASAQSWEFLNPTPTGGADDNVIVTPDGALIAAGTFGAFIRSTDGGQTFETRRFPSRAIGSGIGFVDANTGWAATDNGEIFATTNGGISWTLQLSATLGSGFGSSQVEAVDALTAWVYLRDGQVYRTSDRGATWTPVVIDGDAAFTYIRVFDAQTINIADGLVLRQSTDGGQTWTAKAINTFGVSLNNSAFYFVTPDVGWFTGSRATIVSTTDGGDTWTRQYGSPDSTSFARHTITEVHFADADHGWAAASQCLYRTSDGGDTWDQICGTTGRTRKGSIWRTGPRSGYISDRGGLIYSDDDGETFVNLISGVKERFNEASFVNETTAWTVGSGGIILRTDDGWDTYAVQPTPTTGTLYGVEAANAQTAWAVGDGGTILATSNGGQAWAAQASGVTSTLRDIALLGGTSAVAVGDGQTVLRTTNGGLQWNRIATGLGNDDINGLSFLDDGLRGWAVGDTGYVAVTVDGGQTWAAQTSGVLLDLEDVQFLDAQTGWAVGGSGTLLATVDGGQTWTAQANPEASTITSVFFLDTQTGWASSFNEILLRTTDGGQTWQTDNTTVSYQSDRYVYAASPDLVWMFGSNGHIVRRGTPMSTSAESGTERSGARLAVFPNPSVGAATLALALGTPSEVEVVVLDALGRAVARQRLALGAGEHRLALPAGLAPGLYVVTATAGGKRLGTARMTVAR